MMLFASAGGSQSVCYCRRATNRQSAGWTRLYFRKIVTRNEHWTRTRSTALRFESHPPALGDAKEGAFLTQNSIPCHLNDRAEISSSQGLHSEFCDPLYVWSMHICMGLAFLKAEISNRIKDLISQFSGQLS